MMRKLKKWLVERFFPATAKEEIERLRLEVISKDAEIDRLNAYIDGMEFGIRAQRRTIIRNEIKTQGQSVADEKRDEVRE